MQVSAESLLTHAVCQKVSQFVIICLRYWH